MPTIYSYERVSSGRQTAGSGLSRQNDAAALWAQSRGLELQTFADRGISAFRGANTRSGSALGRFLAAAREGSLGEGPTLLVESIDRLSRQEPLDALQDVVLQLLRCGVTLVTLESGESYSRDLLRDDPSRLVMLTLRVQAAFEYSRRLGSRVKAAHAAARGSGRHLGPMPTWISRTPDGLRLNEHASVIELIFSRSEDGWGVSRIARLLNDRGIRTFSGRTWTSASVQRLMQRPSVYGALVHRDGTTEDDFYPAAISRERFDAAAGRRGQRRFQPSAGTLWIGAGLTTCLHCQRALGTNSSTSRGLSRKRTLHLRCRTPGCSPGSWELGRATSYLLNRLSPGAVMELSAIPYDAAAIDSEIAGARIALDAATARLAALGGALEAEVDPAALGVLARALVAAEQTRDDASDALDALMVRRAEEAASRPVPGLLGEARTPEQRLAINDALHRWGLRIVADRPAGRWGLGLPGRPLVWGVFGKTCEYLSDAVGPRLSEAELADILCDDPAELAAWVAGYRAGQDP